MTGPADVAPGGLALAASRAPTPQRTLQRARLRTRVRWVLALLFVLGAALRAIDLWRPVDGRVRESWRECDEAAIARNFVREGMNILYPRIDWRGDGPGYAEMEFPLFPWTIAVLYKVFGTHEVLGRVLAYGLALATLAVFMALARRLLPWRGAIAASLFFVLSPLVVRVSNALQPEALMLFAYVSAVYAFLRWVDARESGRPAAGWYATAVLATAMAILAKATAAHIGLLFLVILWRRQGRAILRDPQLWAFAAIVLVPSVLWYAHAYHLWLTYGNSLGLSNEDHWIGPDVFRQPAFALGLTTSELFYVWTPAGIMIAAYGLATAPRSPAARVAVPWLIGALIFYLAAIRTTAASWALYYHVFSVGPAALLFGLGVAQLARRRWGPGERVALAATAVAGTAAAGYLLARQVPVGFGSSHDLKLGAAAAAAVCIEVAILTARRRRLAAAPRGAVAVAAGMAAIATLLLLAQKVAAEIHPHPELASFAAAQEFRPLIPAGSLILSSGGACGNEMARHTAYNQSFMFYWLDRKGFNVCRQQQSLERVDEFVRRGARYFVANNGALATRPGFTAALNVHYSRLAASHGWTLFALAPLTDESRAR